MNAPADKPDGQAIRRAQYKSGYGHEHMLGQPRFPLIPPDYSRCAYEVAADTRYGRFEPRQCRRAPGHGPGGAYCKQHAALVMGNAQ